MPINVKVPSKLTSRAVSIVKDYVSGVRVEQNKINEKDSLKTAVEFVVEKKFLVKPDIDELKFDKWPDFISFLNIFERMVNSLKDGKEIPPAVRRKMLMFCDGVYLKAEVTPSGIYFSGDGGTRGFGGRIKFKDVHGGVELGFKSLKDLRTFTNKLIKFAKAIS